MREGRGGVSLMVAAERDGNDDCGAESDGDGHHVGDVEGVGERVGGESGEIDVRPVAGADEGPKPAVDGAVVMLMPAASSTNATAGPVYGEETPTALHTTNPAATSTNPSAIVGPLPIRSASGATAIIVSANGRNATPVSSAE